MNENINLNNPPLPDLRVFGVNGCLSILVGCEESQAVCIELRKLGHEAFSCDLQECSGGHPEWHLQMDVFEAIKLKAWDMAIFFPTCTYVAASGLHWNNKTPGRAEKTQKAIEFVKDLMNAPIPRIAIENPIGALSKAIRKPDQIIQPYDFGHPESKATCLWLKGLPLLQPTEWAEFTHYRCKCGNIFEAELGKYGCCDGAAKPLWNNQTKSGQNKLPPSPDRAKLRSKTYPGIAKAMAIQWTNAN